MHYVSSDACKCPIVPAKWCITPFAIKKHDRTISPSLQIWGGGGVGAEREFCCSLLSTREANLEKCQVGLSW